MKTIDNMPLDRFTLRTVCDFLLSDKFKNIYDISEKNKDYSEGFLDGIFLCTFILERLEYQGNLKDMIIEVENE